MKLLKKLWNKTVEISKLYTGTFIVVMILNQLVFFGFCLNPICLVAAMPHVLLITVIIGTIITKLKKKDTAVGIAASDAYSGFNNLMSDFSDSMDKFNRQHEITQPLRDKKTALMNKKLDELRTKAEHMETDTEQNKLDRKALINSIDEEIKTIEKEIIKIKNSIK
ncbi:MAG: hypothetical protein M0Q98_14780 [Pseudomonas sp.]|nr:hypothetical protein [Thiopseudomonas sp.]MCK9535934.1 hypothetical protein [Pseudomonas sp.]